jgi:hypothetical protein
VVSFHIGLQCWNDQKASLFGRNFDRFAMEIYRMKIGGCWGFHSISSRFFNARPNHPFVVFVAGPFATLHYWTYAAVPERLVWFAWKRDCLRKSCRRQDQCGIERIYRGSNSICGFSRRTCSRGGVENPSRRYQFHCRGCRSSERGASVPSRCRQNTSSQQRHSAHCLRQLQPHWVVGQGRGAFVGSANPSQKQEKKTTMTSGNHPTRSVA